jgi:ABC-type nitrate/sulfonate/bicarbonate transport system permease component
MPGARLAVAAAAVCCWQLAARHAASPYYPPPTVIVPGLYRQWFSGPASHLWLTADATGNLLPSLGRVAGALALASLAGTAAGLAIGRVARLADYAEPLVHFGRAVPPPAMVPVFLFTFKAGTPAEVASIAFGTIWPVLVNTIDGARTVHPGYLETARAFRLGPARRLRRVILPGAAPKILAGLRLGLSLSLLLMIVSEFEGSTSGIGREMSIASASLDIPAMWNVIVLLGLLGITLNGLLALAERHALAWQHGRAQAE